MGLVKRLRLLLFMGTVRRVRGTIRSLDILLLHFFLVRFVSQFSLGSQRLLHRILVVLRHHVILVRHKRRGVRVLMRDIAHNFQERWEFNFGGLGGGLNSHDGRVGLDVQESFDNEVLSLIDITLSEFLNRPLAIVPLL